MKVFIVRHNSQYINMFRDMGWDVVFNIEEADLVQFTGGSDVPPHLYGEEKHPNTYSDLQEHNLDVLFYNMAYQRKIPCAGICKGGQLLNCIAGGKMYQHVDNHGVSNGHQATTHDGKIIQVSSTHHQMMRPSPRGRVLLTACETTYLQTVEPSGVVTELTGAKHETVSFKDVEAVVYSPHESFNCMPVLCYQPHPEFFDVDHDCVKYYFQLIEEFLFEEVT